MGSSAEDVASYLSTEGFGTLGAASGWGIYIGKEPTKPNTTITVYDTGGTMGNPESLYDPTIQVRVRSHSYEDAYEKAEDIRDDLVVDSTARIIGGWLYTGFWLISDIAKIATDENEREVLTVNFRLMREPYSSS